MKLILSVAIIMNIVAVLAVGSLGSVKVQSHHSCQEERYCMACVENLDLPLPSLRVPDPRNCLCKTGLILIRSCEDWGSDPQNPADLLTRNE